MEEEEEEEEGGRGSPAGEQAIGRPEGCRWRPSSR